ncbi:stress responsive A/B barrel domain protein [Cadophora sp. DSE1049]|nr:stress responsive A/B barrel domain protein [Cadophora sp. DSE1049]
MTIIHIVLFKFKPAVTAVQRAEFVKMAKSLKSLSCVKDGRLIVGGPSMTNPISKSKGYDCALVSYHVDLEAVEEYHVTKEHEKLKTSYVLPLTESLVRFDFEVDQEDEGLVGVLPLLGSLGAGKHSISK